MPDPSCARRKVEVKAGPHVRVFELEPRFRVPGRYDAVFYPTVATTYTYRLFGTINGAPFDVTLESRGTERSVCHVARRGGPCGTFRVEESARALPVPAR
jgi:hypothetical protein